MKIRSYVVDGYIVSEVESLILILDLFGDKSLLFFFVFCCYLYVFFLEFRDKVL